MILVGLVMGLLIDSNRLGIGLSWYRMFLIVVFEGVIFLIIWLWMVIV